MKKMLRWLLELGIVIGVVMVFFELSYRFSIIDFYKSEFKALNTTIDTESSEVDFLVFGDSFSASDGSYVDLLRKSSNKTFVNTSVPGIGIKQVNSFAGRRLKEFKPKNIIYQVYVGNDLTDVDHLTNYKTLSFSRNLYWDISDIVLTSSFVNYRLGHLRSKTMKVDTSVLSKSFSVQNYNLRSKIYFQSDTTYLYKAVTITDSFERRYAIWKEELKDFLEVTPEGVNVYIVFIPHCSQVNTFYRNNIRQIGAVFTSENEYVKTNYAFFEKASLDFSKYQNVTFLNPLENFKEADTIDNRLYYLNDPHLNSRGQEVLADYLRTYLRLYE